MPDTTNRGQLAEIIRSYGSDLLNDGGLEDCTAAIIDAGWRPPRVITDEAGPILDPAALDMAGMAFIHGGRPREAVKDAVIAYLFSVANTEPFGKTMTSYPSWADVQAAIARVRAGGNTDV